MKSKQSRESGVQEDRISEKLPEPKKLDSKKKNGKFSLKKKSISKGVMHDGSFSKITNFFEPYKTKNFVAGIRGGGGELELSTGSANPRVKVDALSCLETSLGIIAARRTSPNNTS